MNRETATRQLHKLGNGIGNFILRMDRRSLWWTGILFLCITFLPYLILGEGSVFEIHDQMDETMLAYVLNARHLFDGTDFFPELLGGINQSGMQPSAVLFIPLYRLLSPFAAFLLQYLIVCACGFFGMYACTRELTGSSILAVVAAALFALLPQQPVYGLSVWGVPLIYYAYLCLQRKKHLWLSAALILLFGLTTHLVLIGYVVLSIWALVIFWQLIRRKVNKYSIGGFVLLTGTYVAVNYSLVLELLLGKGDYVSHRQELVNSGLPFWDTVADVFLNSAQHAVSLHKYLILPTLAFLILIGIGYRRLSGQERKRFFLASAMFGLLVGIALLFGFFKSQWVAELKNGISGFLRYFQPERYYWLYPALWILDFILLFSIWWNRRAKWHVTLAKLLLLLALIFPTLNLIKPECYFYQNINQYRNGTGITGYVSWESYYAEDLMQDLEQAIGRDMSDYRVAHLGISPAPSLMHGFYTVDGYSNNYPLEYKHRFRQVIAEELAKNEATAVYFDEWGSRCYLFNASSGTYWNISKRDKAVYETLDFDMEALASLGCEYLFSGGEILCAEDLGLTLLGYYETEDSYWGIWLYQLEKS